MNINEKTLNALVTLLAFEPEAQVHTTTKSSLEVGKSYLIRTVTMTYTGRLVDITDTDFVLEDAAWVADTGRYANALQSGELHEVEPYPDRVSVSRAAYVDAAVWNHPLPRKVK